MNILRCTSNKLGFLVLGLWRTYCPDSDLRHPEDRLQESDGVRIARRNNLALAGIVIVAFAAGTGPQELEVFGVNPIGERGVLTICFTIFACHAYWYFMRWQHLLDDANILIYSSTQSIPPQPLRYDEPRMYSQKSAALYANRVCFLLVLMSFVFLIIWGINVVTNDGHLSK